MPTPSTRADQLFQQAAEVPTADRRAFLTMACQGDPELRREVDRLLSAFNWLGDLPASPGETPTRPPDLAVPDDPDLTGTVLGGRYTLTRRIGQGGMGSVWQAEQTDPMRRTVAVKLIRLERGQSRAILARFAAERQAIAMMDHPHIARLFDAGTTPAGQPFFVMELVNGVPLTTYLRQRALPVPDRLRLFVAICQAVQHAHQKGVIHRDLKPGNILVEEHDGKPVPKVIDFGLAKAAAGGRLADQTVLTGVGHLLGTPLYMAPEQATFNPVDVDTRADVYALGVILYELLAGSTPIPREVMSKAPLDEMLALVREYHPPPPSARMTPRVPHHKELDWVVLKALAKERERRYESVTALGRDVERFLAGEPVAAAPPSAGYRVRKFAQRHRVPVLAAAVVLLALVGGVVGISVSLLVAEERRNEAESAAAAEKGAREREVAQRVRAEAASERTRQVLDAMVSGVTGDSLSTQKEITAEQKKFLSEVLTYYREFAGEQADDEKTRTRTANAAYRVGLIEDRLGRKAEGIVALQIARDGYLTLVADFPAVPDYRQELARSHNNLGALLADLGRRAEAEEQYSLALAINEKLAADFPAVPDYRQELARSHNNLGLLLAGGGKPVEAKEQYKTALAIRAKLAADFPAVPDYRLDLARSHNNLGLLLAGFAGEFARQERPTDEGNSLGLLLAGFAQLAAAEVQYRKALEGEEKLAADFPAVPHYRSELAGTHNNLGNLLTALNRRPEAEEQYRRAMAVYEKLAADFPAVPAFRVELGGMYSNFGCLVRNGGKPEESLAWFQKAIDTLGPVHQTEPRDVKAKLSLRNSHANRASVYDLLERYADAVRDWDRAIELSDKPERPGERAYRAMSKLRAGQAAEAVAEVEELRTIPGWDAGKLYDFACAYAVAGEKAGDKRDEYAGRAIEMLAEAVKAGFTDAVKLRTEKHFNPIRDRDDFKKLVADLEKKFPPKKETLPPPKPDK